MIQEGCSLEYAAAHLYSGSLCFWEWLAKDSKAGKDDVWDKQFKRYSHVLQSGREPEEVPQTASDQGSINMPMEGYERKWRQLYGNLRQGFTKRHYSRRLRFK